MGIKTKNNGRPEGSIRRVRIYFSLGSISESFGYERVIGNCEPDKRKVYKK